MAAAFRFDLDANWLCLDFVNTRGLASGEHLAGYADLLAFADQSGLLTPAEADRLHAEAERDAEAAEAVLRRAIALREALRRVFSALAAGQDPPAEDLESLNANLAISLAHACLRPVPPPGSGYAWGWQGQALDAPIWPIARSAADLLTDDQQRARLRECNAADCAWLFLDTSKNHTRQWCSMRSCGNREKARRHYQRLRAQRTGTGAAEASPSSAADGSASRGAAVPPRRRPGRRSAAGRADDASATAG